MTWVDMAALTLIRWGAVQGYLKGFPAALLRLLTVMTALAAAVFLADPLAVYMQNEWRLEAVFVDWLHKVGKTAIPVTQPGGSGIVLPPLSAPLLRSLMPELALLPALSTREQMLSLLAALAVRLLALLLALFFCLALNRFMWQNKNSGRSRQQAEWLRLAGLMAGADNGLLIALAVCLVVDACSLFAGPQPLLNDLAASYLARTAAFLVQQLAV